jgi:hypothetical protein
LPRLVDGRVPGQVAQRERGEATAGQIHPGVVGGEQVVAVEADRFALRGDEPGRVDVAHRGPPV